MPRQQTRPSTHPRNPAQTKARLLIAAREEFAEHGFAGARVDRIGERAEANKRLLYAYFGNKEAVFAAVVTDCVAEFNAAVPFDLGDLPGYAGRVFDFLADHPLTDRVLAWRDVERVTPTPIELELYGGKLAAIAAEQEAGRLGRGFDPVDLLALIEAIIGSWLGATVGLRGAADDPSPQRRLQHRDAVVEAVSRIIAS